MALKQILTANGESYISSEWGKISLGNKNVTVLCICKVVFLQSNKTTANIQVEFVGENFNSMKIYDFKPSVADGSTNFIAQAYEHLKTLPEFADATDC